MSKSAYNPAGGPGPIVIGGPTFFGTNFTMATNQAEEDVTGYSVSFTYDGRPVRIVSHNPAVSHNHTTINSVELKLARSTDSAIQAVGAMTTPAAAWFGLVVIDTGPITAWPSDSDPFVIGNSYTFKVRIDAIFVKGSINAGVAGYRSWIAAFAC